MDKFREQALKWKKIPSRQTPELTVWLNDQKKKFDWTEDNGEFLYCYQHNILNIPICEYENCNNKKRFISSAVGYRLGCSKTHNTILTNREKYGVDNVFQNKEIQSKYKSTIQLKYGTDQYFQSDDFKSKTDLAEQGKKSIELQKANNIKKYGKEFLFQVDEIQNKIQQHNLEKYGTKSPLTHKDIFIKTKQTNLEKYGTEHHFMNDTIKDKIKKTNLKRYGVENPSQSLELKNNKYKLTYYDKIQKIPELKLLCSSEEFMGVYADKIYNWECRDCYTTFEDSLENGRIPQCPKCNPKKRSSMETEFINSVLSNLVFKQNYCKLQFDDGKRFEIDFLIEGKLGIELNGNYWHSELHGNKDKDYHLNKTIITEKNNIQLIHIFEDEWLFNREIVKSIVLSKLGKYETRLYARKCEIKIIDNNLKNEFLEENHLQGQDKSSVKLGLFYNDVLVSIMTFGKSRFNKNYQFEMHRFCNKLGYQIIGGASKLFNFFIKTYKPQSIITYADRRYSNGTFYEKIGFTKLRVSAPNFFVLGKNKLERLSRLNFQKHILKDKLDNFDPNLSSWENMMNHGYDRIWDSGNFVFEWKKK